MRGRGYWYELVELVPTILPSSKYRRYGAQKLERMLWVGFCHSVRVKADIPDPRFRPSRCPFRVEVAHRQEHTATYPHPEFAELGGVA